MNLDDYLARPLPFANQLAVYLKPVDMRTIVEVGCCEGEDTIKMSRTYPHATIHAFEPLPDNVELTQKHLKQYQAERVELHDIALSNEAGSATFYVSSGRPENATEDIEDWDYGNKSSSLMKPNKNSGVNKWLKFNKKIKVKTERLDTICKERGISEIDLIYMDVQGAELMVLEGAGGMLQHTKAIWLEVEAVELYKDQPLRSDVETFMGNAGFIRVMDTVDDVAGDQLYFNKQFIKHHDPSVSIIMAAHSADKYLFQTIESVLNQTFFDFEFLIFGAAKEAQREIKQRYGDPRIRFLESPSQQMTDILGQAQKEVKSELIALIDANGFARPTRLERQVSYLASQPDVALVGSNFEVIDEDGQPVENLNDLTDYWQEKPLVDGGVMLRKAALNKAVEHTELKKLGLMQVVSQSASVSILPETLYGLRLPNNVTDPIDNTLNRITADYLLWLNVTASFPKGFRGQVSAFEIVEDTRNHFKRMAALDNLSDMIKLQTKCWYNLSTAADARIWLEKHIETANIVWSRLKNQQSGQLPVSVVMGVYNGESYLREAIQSILDQTYKKFEFIIIDDGSSDTSAKIVQSFKDERIRLVPQSNHRLVYTLNQGLNLARGKLIARMDADDRSLPARLEKEIEVMNMNPDLGLVGTFFGYIEGGKGKPTGTTITSLTRSIDLKRSFYIVNPFGHGSTMYRRRAVLEVGGYSNEYGPTEDYELWRRLGDRWEVTQIPEVLYMYRLNPEGISSKQNKEQHKFAELNIRKQLEKPFIGKSLHDIIYDASYYKNLDSEFADTLYHQYINEQFLLALLLLHHNSLKIGGLQALGAFRLEPKRWRWLVRPLAGAIRRRLRLYKK